MGLIKAKEPRFIPHAEIAEVFGRNTVRGTVKVSGFKIAAIPIIAATVLTEQPVELVNLPQIEDVEVLLHLLEFMGGEVEREGNVTRICTASLLPSVSLPADVVNSVHGTLYLLPALLARFGRVRVARTQGGCCIGERPVSHILSIMERLGARVSTEGGDILAEASELHGTELSAQFSVEWDKYRSGATKTALLMGARAHGVTTIHDAYQRASITQLAAFLRCLGAEVCGEGTSDLTVRGGDLGGCRFEIEGDYLESLTYLCLVAACGGTIEVRGFRPHHCRAELDVLKEMGLFVEEFDDGVLASCPDRTRPVSFTTREVDTDIQPVFAAALTMAEGRSVITEIVWENRFGYSKQLNLMGASTCVSGNKLMIDGVGRLKGALVKASDLRAAAALLLAAAGSEGKSVVEGLGHLSRGYVDLLGKLGKLGVKLRMNTDV